MLSSLGNGFVEGGYCNKTGACISMRSLEKLVHIIMEAEKFHNLSFANHRCRKAGGVILSRSKGLRSRGCRDVKLSHQAGEDEMICLSLASEAEKGPNLFFLYFALFKHSTD
jgi:hypothetical protein